MVAPRRVTALCRLSLEAKVPRHGRFIFAGYGDRLALPDQAQRLWEHWEQPRISWYRGATWVTCGPNR